MEDYQLFNLLAYDGRRMNLQNGWCMRFSFLLVNETPARPHGIKYSLTLHDISMTRLLGFDNAHGIPRYATYDHKHPFKRVHDLQPYKYIDADTLISDFFTAVEHACKLEDVPFEFDDNAIELEDGSQDDEKVPD